MNKQECGSVKVYDFLGEDTYFIDNDKPDKDPDLLYR